MDIEYKKEWNHNFLVLNLEESQKVEDYTCQMLLHNQIQGALTCQMQTMDNQKKLCYEITSRQNLETLYENKMMDENIIQTLILSIIQVLEQMEDYLLKGSQLLLLPQYIFQEIETKTIYFCILPYEYDEIQKSFVSLMEYVLTKADHRDEKAVLLSYGVYRKCAVDYYTFTQIKEWLYEQGTTKLTKEELYGESLPENRASRKMKAELPWEEKAEATREEQLDILFEEEQEKARKTPVFVELLKSLLIGGIVFAAVFLLLSSPVKYYITPGIIVGAGVGATVLITVISTLSNRIKKKAKEKETDEFYADKQLEESEDDDNREKSTYKKEKYSYDQEEYPVQEKDQPVNGIERWKEIMEENKDSEETIFLSDFPIRRGAKLKCMEGESMPDIMLNKEVTLIGKLAETVDEVIEIPTISRIHAKIRRQNGKWIIMDMNSRNGTFVNGKELVGDMEVELAEGDEVMFADVKFKYMNL
ncbi:MAG: DUF6382 domain-containing protein [Lachnospiraceae bacterium]|nr:DUF6382 domain-containing protein [Lachnospiraceae bacterium]MDD3614820.1 DUF6382 domain-containing protein [Lachnospiraceae bacterium]